MNRIAQIERKIEAHWDSVFYWLNLNNINEANKNKLLIDKLESELAVCIKSEGF